jgi:hypothetical protein
MAGFVVERAAAHSLHAMGTKAFLAVAAADFADRIGDGALAHGMLAVGVADNLARALGGLAVDALCAGAGAAAAYYSVRFTWEAIKSLREKKNWLDLPPQWDAAKNRLRAALEREHDKVECAVRAQEGVWLVRASGRKNDWQPMTEAEFKAFELSVAAMGGRLNRVVVDERKILMERFVGGRLHGDTKDAPARMVYSPDGSVSRMWFRDGRDVTREVAAAAEPPSDAMPAAPSAR